MIAWQLSGALTHLNICIEIARGHKADVSHGEAAAEELQQLMNRKIEALARLAPAAFDAHNVLLVLKLTAQERLETCLAELTAALEQAKSARGGWGGSGPV